MTDIAAAATNYESDFKTSDRSAAAGKTKRAGRWWLTPSNQSFFNARLHDEHKTQHLTRAA
jgi:hypothetical protein